MRLAHAHQRARARRAAPAVPPRPARCACPPAHCQQPTRESTPFTPNPPHGLPADHPAHGPRSASRRRPRPPTCRACARRALARCPLRPPLPMQTNTPAPFTPNPPARHEAFCHPRLALARRRAGAHPCPCRAHVPAARSRVARLRGAPALARHPAGVPSQRASQPAAALRRPPAALPALARRCAGARCPPRRDLACRPLSAARSRVARLRGAPALARHCAGVPSQRASQLAAALRRARPMPSLPSHGDAPAPGARPAVALPAGRCPPAAYRPLAHPCPRAASHRRLVPVPACHAHARRRARPMPSQPFPSSRGRPPAGGRLATRGWTANPLTEARRPPLPPHAHACLPFRAGRRAGRPCRARPCHHCPASRVLSPCGAPPEAAHARRAECEEHVCQLLLLQARRPPAVRLGLAATVPSRYPCLPP